MIAVSAARQARFDSDSRRRAERYGVPYERVLLTDVLAKTGGRCANQRCRVVLTPQTFQADHRKPISRRGWHTLPNLWPLCETCNKAKWAHHTSDCPSAYPRKAQDALWTGYGIDAPLAKHIGTKGIIDAPQCWTLALKMSGRAALQAMRLGEYLSIAMGCPVEVVAIPGAEAERGLVVVGVRIPRKVQPIVPLRVMPPARGLAFQLGLTAWGQRAGIDLAANTTPHLIVAGASGGGKSVAMQAAIRALVLGNAPSALRLAICDPSGKMRAVRPFARLAHLLYPLAETPADTLAIIAAFEREIRRRGREDDRLAPPWVLVIDELAQLEAPGALKTILSVGREMGIHCIAAMQAERAADIDPRWAGQFGARLCTRVAPNDTWTSTAILGSTCAKHLQHEGDAYLYTPTGLSRVKIAYAPDNDAAWTCDAWQAVQADAAPDALAQGALPRPNARRKQPDTPPAPAVEWVEGILESEGKLPAINRFAKAVGVGNGTASKWLGHLASFHPIPANAEAG